MGIYRGPGGTGDAVADTSNQSASAVASAIAAANSATSAATSASSAASSATSAASSATNAATSATSASNSATTATNAISTTTTNAVNASISETNANASAALAQDWATKTAGPVAGGEFSSKYNAQLAASSASAASTSATNAASSASNAATSATNAANSATSAADSYDQFDDRYLGSKASNPTVDNDGNPLLEGALYWNSTSKNFAIYDGASWRVIDRIAARVLESTANSATPTLNTNNYDMMVITGQSVAITSFTTNLSGSPVNGQKLWIAITGTTSIAITWGSSFEATTIALPTTTSSTNRLDVGFVWNSTTSKWRCVATA